MFFSVLVRPELPGTNRPFSPPLGKMNGEIAVECLSQLNHGVDGEVSLSSEHLSDVGIRFAQLPGEICPGYALFFDDRLKFDGKINLRFSFYMKGSSRLQKKVF